MAALNLKSLAAYLGTAEASAALASTVVDAADAAADAGPLVVFYTNCQGRGLAYWLSKSPEFKRSYPRVRFIAVHDLVDRRAEDFTPAQKALLGACALVVYQPIGAKHGRFATTETGAWALLPQKTKRVGFAYLYDECCFPLYMTRGAVCARGAAAVRAAVARARARGETLVEAARAVRASLSAAQPTATTSSMLRARTADSLGEPAAARGAARRPRRRRRRGGRPPRVAALPHAEPPGDGAARGLRGPRPAGARVRCVAAGAYESAGPNEAGIPGRVFPPCVFDRPHRIVGAAPAPVPAAWTSSSSTAWCDILSVVFVQFRTSPAVSDIDLTRSRSPSSCYCCVLVRPDVLRAHAARGRIFAARSRPRGGRRSRPIGGRCRPPFGNRRARAFRGVVVSQRSEFRPWVARGPSVSRPRRASHWCSHATSLATRPAGH